MTGSAHVQRLADLERTVRKLGEAQRDQATALQARIAAVGDRVAQQPTAKDLQELLQAVRGLGTQIDRSIEDQLAHGGTVERQRLDERRL
ncbi:MAG: hypothetical protein ACREI7_03505, partial [Myxococcota bacterium]